MRPTVTGSQPPTLAAAKKKCPPEAHLAFSEAIVSPPAAPHPSLVNDKGAKRSAGQGLPSRVLGRIGIGSSSPPVQPRRSKHTNPSPAPGLDRVCNQVWERNPKRDSVLKLSGLRAAVYFVQMSAVGRRWRLSDSSSFRNREKLLVGQTKTTLHNDVSE
jgi:hypothetical protein